MTRLIQTISLILAFSLIAISAVHAHKVMIFAWVEGGRILTESKFSGGKMVKNGTVSVFDSNGHQLLEGRTDDEGRFAFPVTTITDLDIVLTAGMGHQNSWRLSAVELDAVAPEPLKTLEPLASTETLPAANPSPVQPTAGSSLTAREVEAIVSRQLEQKLQPLTRMIVAAQVKGPSARDIFGGIGYILGLVGLGAYLRYRKKGRRP